MGQVYTSGRWNVREGQEDAFVAAWEEFIRSATARSEAGTFRLLRSVEQPRLFVSFGDWENDAAQADWRSSDEFARLMATLREHVDDMQAGSFEEVSEVR